MSFSSWPLEKRFAVLCSVVLLLLGTVILYGNLWFVKKQLLHAAARYSERWTNSIIRHQFRDSEFDRGLTDDEIRKKNSYFNKNVLNPEIQMVRVYNRKGTIVFSDRNELIGLNLPVVDYLLKSLNGETIARFLDNGSEFHPNQAISENDMLEVFAPIYAEDDKTILGAFELHIFDPALFSQIGYNYQIIILSVVGAMIMLHVVLMSIMKKASSTILTQSKEITELYLKLDNSLELQEKVQIGTIKALLETLNAKDNYTAGHSVRVAEYAVRLGEKLGLPDDKIKTLEEAALFHDIGKIGIPGTVLNKPGRFSDAEYDLMKKHPLIGANIVGSIQYFKDHAVIIRHHHERLDGTGYPNGLTADEIPLESKILAVADMYDALTSDRPYRKGLTKEAALKAILEVQDTHLDKEIVKKFLEITGAGQ